MRRFIGSNRIARKLTFGVQNAIQLALLAGHKQPESVRRVRDCARRGHSLLSSDEAFTLHEIAHAQSVLCGSFAEFGVYRGASAALICAVKGTRELHLFDTFEGLPSGCESQDGRVFQKGQFSGTLKYVREVLNGETGVFYHKGFFPDTTAGLEDLRFSFVHLDVDLHDATLAGLEFFYPRMVSGGIILTHDYSIIPGVKRAFETFFSQRPERIIELPTTQAMIIRACLEEDTAQAA
ncbi:TylF/MycF/NovP-related O-methyltransferase [Gluconobacter wancherniae]|uniref:Methyltransferase n=1 Tax=Gluconobacter wancherniae NBRC 103581 TaxID=656744 RepID=A0A511B4L0_9PROT|nr:TylF/MycF/NovP-related O-methyltransferase [Gluconobacter wancherniae]MBF0852940.1 macrocin-O-methyltransferase [Gluconobacter wancherniae]GBD56343.1 hypothetical protein NBRC103581_00918 [Gluconobacter wancherniae NBRC 103581]GBR63687.1 macrocin-O-methyltransferase [Gluconobacter wancherniae NBRC 103581]GEK92757.1 hypothetical protein GWA01_05270 [Gluconobacter wancherniae NBRC 103581]